MATPHDSFGWIRASAFHDAGDFAYTIRYIRIYMFDEQTRRWLLQQQYSRRQD